MNEKKCKISQESTESNNSNIQHPGIRHSSAAKLCNDYLWHLPDAIDVRTTTGTAAAADSKSQQRQQQQQQ